LVSAFFTPLAAELLADETLLSEKQTTNPSGILTKKEFQVLYGKAVAALKDHDVKAAKENFLKLTEADPNFSEGYGWLGLLCLQSGDAEVALRYLGKAADLGSQNPQVHYTLATLLAISGDLERAKRAYLEAVKINPQMGNAYHDLGMLYFRMGKNQDAIDAFLKALEINPQSTKAMLSIGMAYIKAGKPENAVEYITRLRDCNDEMKATHLEALLRGLQAEKVMKEPDASNLVPDGSKARRPGKTPQKTALSGTAQINMKAKPGGQTT
jgi:Flp pilus assembly protein TadD